jgi:hypothetical protein
MSGSKVSAREGSTAVGGDVNAPLTNVYAPEASVVNVMIDQRIARDLPSFLGKVIVLFSGQSLSEYGLGARRKMPPEVTEKIKYNNLSPNHLGLSDYYRYFFLLERAYLGVEQQNADARVLVRRRAAISYASQVAKACRAASIIESHKLDYVRGNADALVEMVVNELLESYKTSNELKVEQETAHLAVSLVVVDAVVECDVLERPSDAATA